MPRADLPSGTVTLLFTDVEGSTLLLHELGPEPYAAALLEHRRLLREAFVRHGGVEVDTEGDAFFVAFPDAAAAVAAAEEAQAALASGPIRVRMGLHTGTPHLTSQGYVGTDVHKGARIAAAAHGGQVVLSRETRSLLGERFDLADLGEHRVKDFAEPVWIYQLGSERFPPLKTISNTNLPRPASAFVGREREVSEIGALLSDGARLVTLTGPGGTGKTRLALEAAAELVPSFKNGTFWVPLAALREPALVADTIAGTIGAKDGLADAIGEREMLLLLDNLEQVVQAAPELATLVEACPNLRLLVTSRERLRVRGETEYAVPPLSDVEAVELFCERSGLPADETILELCRRLDDLPLAVELAAARSSVLSPGQITERLSKRLDMLKGGRDAEARQATLRATIEWSYELLSPEEQALFTRLSVFRGGWTLEAAETICDADLDILAALVDKSLVRRIDDRFSMLESIREFAAERLEASGEADTIRRRHADFFLALAEEAFPELKGSPGDWLDRLEAEHDNLRWALDHLESLGRTQTALELAGALYRFWYFRGHLREARERLDRLLAADQAPTAARARALHGSAVMAINMEDAPGMRARAQEAQALLGELGDPWGVAYSVYLMGMAATEEKDWAVALPLFEDARERFRALGDGHYVLLSGDGIAWVTGELGDREGRRKRHEEVLADARVQGDEITASFQLDQLGTLLAKDGQVAEALSMKEESLQIRRRLGLAGFIVESLFQIADTLAVAGRDLEAARLLGATQALRETVGGGAGWVPEAIADVLGQLEERMDPTDLSGALEEGRRLSLDEATDLALKGVGAET